MNETLLSVLLCLPFAVVALITGAIFLTAGYKKGPNRALFSAAITVLTALISIFVSKLLAGSLSSALLGMVPLEDLSSVPEFAPLVTSMVQGVLQAVLALVLFSLVLLVLLLVLKCVGNGLKNGIFSKLDDWDRESKSLRWQGLGIRAVDTLLVSFLLLLPLYGTLASVVSPAAKMMRYTQTNAQSSPYSRVAQARQDELSPEEILYAVADHPLVCVYKEGPASWVMDELSNVGISGTSVSITGVTKTLEGLMQRVDRLMAAVEAEDVQKTTDCLEDLGRYARNHLVDQDWIYDLLTSYKQQLEGILEEYARDDAEAQKVLEEVMSFLDMSREDFQANANALLDFGLFCLENFSDNVINDKEPTPEEWQPVCKELGKLVNGSKQLILVRNYALGELSREIFAVANGVDLDREYTDPDLRALAEKVRKDAEAFVLKLPVAPIPAEEFEAEGEALIALMSSGYKSDLIAGLACLPYVDKNDLLPLINSNLLQDDVFFEENSDSEKLIGALRARLLKADPQSRLGECAHLCQQLYASREDSSYGSLYLSLNEYTLDFLLNDLGSEYLTRHPLLGKEVVDMLGEMAAQPSLKDGEGYVDLCDLQALLARDNAWWPEEVEAGRPYYSHSDPYGRLYEACRRLCAVPVFVDALEDLVEAQGTDPWRLGASLTQKQRSTFSQLLQALRDDQYVDPDAISNSYEGSSGVLMGDLIASLDGAKTPIAIVDGQVVKDVDLSGLDLSGVEILGEGSYVIGSTGAGVSFGHTKESAEENNRMFEKGTKAIAAFFGV